MNASDETYKKTPNWPQQGGYNWHEMKVSLFTFPFIQTKNPISLK
jgi:hypothetical protein